MKLKVYVDKYYFEDSRVEEEHKEITVDADYIKSRNDTCKVNIEGEIAKVVQYYKNRYNTDNVEILEVTEYNIKSRFKYVDVEHIINVEFADLEQILKDHPDMELLWRGDYFHLRHIEET